MSVTGGTQTLEVMPAGCWRPLAAAHAERVDALTRGHRDRVGRGAPHPVEDFLFTYYTLRPAHLRRWYPGAGVALEDAPERAGWRFHRVLAATRGPMPADRSPTDSSPTGPWPTKDAPTEVATPGRTGSPGGPTVVLDLPAFRLARGDQLAFTARLLRATVEAPGQFGCFGLHEWAMVFGEDDGRRHRDWPLRLGRAGTDEVVRDHQIRCTHYDAFRFFTAPARPRNLLQPERGSQAELEQPGCLHAGMDLYKWAYKLIPAVPSDLLVATFELARSIRELDMRASPYDLSALGYRPVRIETPAGKAEYVAAQREFARVGQVMRCRLLDVVDRLAQERSGSARPDGS